MTLSILVHSARAGFADYAVMFPPAMWMFGWLTRVFAQVTFFALIGQLLGSQEQVRFLLIGNVVLIAVMHTMIAAASTTAERSLGTLPLLVAAPATHVTVFLGRGLCWMVSGVLSATVALVVIAPLFGVALPWPRVLLFAPLTLLVAASTYLFATFLASLLLRMLAIRSVITHLAWLLLTAFCGVVVPVTFWPLWIQRAAELLPLTHGLAAIRALLDGAPLDTLVPLVAAEAAVGAGWLLAAVLGFHQFVEAGRRDGSLEYT